jgi:2,4-dienoyl-CoA reductase-like NADH-dependent reductase (Old Yellow Enzyme family)
MDSLFQETGIKSLSLANRFVRSATWMGMADPDGGVTPALLQCYETLAAGGIGLIISGFAFVSREGQGPEGQLGIHSDELVDGLRELTGRVHDRGGNIAAQIVHCGILSKKEHNRGLEILGPSEKILEDGSRVGRALLSKEISRIVRDFGAAAARAKEAGFDGIQLHFAHGYLGSQFLNPAANRREDEYGGSIENRCRFLIEVYDATREAVGGGYPVMAKLNVEDFQKGGLAFDEGKEAAVILKKRGLDALEVSGGSGDSKELGPARRIKEEEEEAYFLKNAAEVKKATGMKVMLVGGLRTPSSLARIHEEHGIDYFSLSRPFIREPHLINRWKRGDLTRAACVSCSGCFLSIRKGRGVFCIKDRKDKAKPKG